MFSISHNGGNQDSDCVKMSISKTFATLNVMKYMWKERQMLPNGITGSSTCMVDGRDRSWWKRTMSESKKHPCQNGHKFEPDWDDPAAQIEIIGHYPVWKCSGCGCLAVPIM
eukprot:g80498.t1